MAALFAAVLAAASAQAQDEPAPGTGHKAKAALDDRADPRVRTDDVGKAGRMGRKDLAPGAYFNDRNRAAVRAYCAAHEGKGAPAPQWHIGEKLPAAAVVTPVPKEVLAQLPRVPPGHHYVQASHDVLLIATGSHMVVDGISAPER